MKCSEFIDLAPGYALDALSESERLACARHLAEEGPHEGCEETLARYERVVDALGTAVPGAPVDASVWHAIESRIGQRSRPKARRAPMFVAYAAAAAALLAALYTQQRGTRIERARERTYDELTSTAAELARTQTARVECARDLERLQQQSTLARDAVALLEDSSTRVTQMAATDQRPFRATTLYSPTKKRALAISSTIAPVPGKDYELWVIAGNQPPKPAGFLRFDASGVAVGEFDAALLRGAAPDALAISLEPLGGRPTPTDVVLLAKLRG